MSNQLSLLYFLHFSHPTLLLIHWIVILDGTIYEKVGKVEGGFITSPSSSFAAGKHCLLHTNKK